MFFFSSLSHTRTEYERGGSPTIRERVLRTGYTNMYIVSEFTTEREEETVIYYGQLNRYYSKLRIISRAYGLRM